MALNKQGELQQQESVDLSPRFNTAAEAPRIDGIAPRESGPRSVDVFGNAPDRNDLFYDLVSAGSCGVSICHPIQKPTYAQCHFPLCF